jgi:hypothetical protein
MAQQRVGTGRNDFLVRRQFDGRGGESVFPEDEKNTEEAEPDQDISSECNPGRHVRPREAAIQRRDDKQPDISQRRKRHDDPLRRQFLGRGAPQPAIDYEVNNRADHVLAVLKISARQGDDQR